MDSIFLLVPIVIIFVAGAVKLFFWAVNNGQYDDLETEGRRILFDEEIPRESASSNPSGDSNDSPSDNSDRMKAQSTSDLNSGPEDTGESR